MTVNKVILIGNLGQKPEKKFTNSGEAYVHVSLATNENQRNPQGGDQYVKVTQWHNLTFWRRNAEVVAEYLDKGSTIYVEGKIQYSKYVDNNGIERNTTKIVVTNFTMLGSKNEYNDDVSRRQADNNPGVGFGGSNPLVNNGQNAQFGSPTAQPQQPITNSGFSGSNGSNLAFGQGNNNFNQNANQNTNREDDDFPW